MSFLDPILLASDFSGLAYEGFFLLFLIFLVLISTIALAIWALRKFPAREVGQEPGKRKSIWSILAGIWLILGSLAIAVISDSPFHELLFSRMLKPFQVWPSLIIVVLGIILVLLALRNARSFRSKFWLWTMMVWFGYLALAFGLAVVRL